MCQCNRLENEQSVLPVCMAWVYRTAILEAQGHTSVLAQSAAVYLGRKQRQTSETHIGLNVWVGQQPQHKPKLWTRIHRVKELQQG